MLLGGRRVITAVLLCCGLHRSRKFDYVRSLSADIAVQAAFSDEARSGQFRTVVLHTVEIENELFRMHNSCLQGDECTRKWNNPEGPAMADVGFDTKYYYTIL